MDMSKGVLGYLPEGFNTRAMLAKKIGRSVSTIKNAEHDGTIIAYRKEMQCGNILVKVYHDDDIPAIIAAMRKRRPGRPRTKHLHPAGNGRDVESQSA